MEFEFFKKVGNRLNRPKRTIKRYQKEKYVGINATIVITSVVAALRMRIGHLAKEVAQIT